jgi:hypothetical protein
MTATITTMWLLVIASSPMQSREFKTQTDCEQVLSFLLKRSVSPGYIKCFEIQK